MPPEVKKFFTRGLIFALPLILFFGFSFFVLFFSGELTSIDYVVNYQKSHRSSLVGWAYSNPLRYFKLQSVLVRKPEIIMLGSSNTAYFRSAFFNSPTVFYNASTGGAFLQDFLIFLNLIPIKDQPKIIFAGLDPNFFDARCHWSDYFELSGQYTTGFNDQNSFKAWQYGFTQLYKDYFFGKFSLRDLPKFLHPDGNFGINAVINKNGYRWDGSGTPTSPQHVYQRLTESDQTFQQRIVADFFSRPELKKTCEEKKRQTINEVKQFLSQSKTRGIYVIGYIIPYTPVVYKQMREMGNKYDHVLRLGSSLKPVFEQFGFKLHDFSDLAKINISDKEMTDESHPSEKAALKLFLQILSREPVLWPYSNASYLKKRLEQAPNNLFVFENEEF